MRKQDKLIKTFVKDTDTYIFLDGIIYRKIGKKVKVVGHSNGDGYTALKYMGEKLYTHRIIFYKYFKRLPRYIDHRDSDKSNNHLLNLREATCSENAKNRRYLNGFIKCN